jgi:hypothetical protein
MTIVVLSDVAKRLITCSVEKHEPASDIDTAVVDSLKALDHEWPIREADSFDQLLGAGEQRPHPIMSGEGSIQSPAVTAGLCSRQSLNAISFLKRCVASSATTNPRRASAK